MTTTKWGVDPSDIPGPIQLKRVNKAIGGLRWEGDTFYTAHRGFLGDPVDPDDLRFATTSLFIGERGGDGRRRTDDAADELGERFGWLVSKKNAKEIVAAFEEATKEAAKSRPIKDERRTREEDQRVKEVVAEVDAKRKVETDGRKAVTDELRSLAPEWATCAIVAELKEDTSDPQSDYFSNRTVRTVAIGWRTGKREDFKQLRKAAAAFLPETEWEERRDNYSLGAGNYLSDHGWDGAGSGWVVKSRELSSDWWTVTEIADSVKGVSV
jgi:hypothetical protein